MSPGISLCQYRTTLILPPLRRLLKANYNACGAVAVTAWKTVSIHANQAGRRTTGIEMTLSGPGTDAYPTLFSPGKIGTVELANRAIVSPMTRTSATAEGIVTDAMVDYYAEFARGGWGLVISEATYIDLKYSQGYRNQPGMANDAQQESWRRLIEAVHAEGVPFFMQLIHAGAVNQGNNWVEGSIAPSAVQPLGEEIPRYDGKGPFQMPREITRDEMDEVAASFATAAARAIEVGFDGVEVHGANGYIMDQFLTTYTNQRTDEYGGDIENRVRFHIDVMTAVRNAVDAAVPVGVRISQTKVNDLEYSWPGGDDDAKVVFPKVAATGIDFIDCSAHLGCAPVFGTDKSLSGLAKRYSGIAQIANGKLHDPAEAERALTQGEGDFCAITKGALADPAWPRKIAAGEVPIPFDPGMTTPLATLANTANWRLQQAAE
jgi:2,4-dienoyl-CoA reductase-like NADH-dependent reductase (Old Yellow Enzyme family)